MARSVKVGAFQAMQRQQATDQIAEADPFAIDPAAEDAAATARLKEIGCGPIEPKSEDRESATNELIAAFSRGDDEIDEDWEETPTAEEVASFDTIAALISLNVESICTAEMSLHMITERVRVAAEGLPNAHEITESDVVLEAERIWVSLDRKRSHTYSVEQDGSVRDWRRPDTTPDGGDVTKEHTITDGEPRFSGAGAGQARQVSTLIPADKDFGGKSFREASELVSLADELIGEHGYFEHLEHCTIRYFWRRKTGVSKGQRITGGLDRGSGLKGFLLGADFAIWLAADTARERQFDDRRVRRHLFRQLRRIGQDDKGNWIELPFTLQIFTEEITEFADVGDDDLRIGRGAFRNADQMGLFRDDADDDEEGEAAEQAYFDAAGEEMERDRARDDGAGVLIHADGTALTDDEIEAMERHELNDDDADLNDEEDDDSDPNEFQPYDDQGSPLDAEELQEQRPREPFMADVPADPDGPAPDELDDDL